MPHIPNEVKLNTANDAIDGVVSLNEYTSFLLKKLFGVMGGVITTQIIRRLSVLLLKSSDFKRPLFSTRRLEIWC